MKAESTPVNKDRILKLAGKYIQQGKIAAAIEEYQKLVEADPDALTMINALGDLCVRAGRTGDAIASFLRVAESYRKNGFTVKAIGMYKKINKLDPYNYDTCLKLAELYAKQGLIIDAREQYLIVADAYKRCGQPVKAIDIQRKVVELDPDNTCVQLKFADQYKGEGLNDEAHEAYLQAGKVFLRKGIINRAIQACESALAINPDSRPALKTIVDALVQQGELQKALEMLNKFLEKDPSDIDLIIILGRAYIAGKMLEEAEATFRRLLEFDKSRYDYLLEVGRRFLERREFDRTIAIADQCIDLLIARRQEEKAILLLKGVLEHDANNMGALKRLTNIYLCMHEDHNLVATLKMVVEAALRQGLKAEAVDALKELIELEPNERSYIRRLASLSGSSSGDKAIKTAQTDIETAEEQLRKAEMFGGLGHGNQATELLGESDTRYSKYIEIQLDSFDSLELNQIFTDGGLERSAQIDDVSTESSKPLPIDNLTDIPSRHCFDKILKREWRRAIRSTKPLSLIIISFDCFLSCAGTCGQSCDGCIKWVVGMLNSELKRGGDLLTCYDGEALAIILPEAHEEGAALVAEAMRARINVDSIRQVSERLSVSMGVATTVPQRNSSPNALVAAARQALRQAKRTN